MHRKVMTIASYDRNRRLGGHYWRVFNRVHLGGISTPDQLVKRYGSAAPNIAVLGSSGTPYDLRRKCVRPYFAPTLTFSPRQLVAHFLKYEIIKPKSCLCLLAEPSRVRRWCAEQWRR